MNLIQIACTAGTIIISYLIYDFIKTKRPIKDLIKSFEKDV